MRGLLVLLLVPLAARAAACTGDEEGADPPTTTSAPPTTTAPAPPPTTTEPDEVALVPTPAGALRRCRRAPAVAPACPREVPEAPYDPTSPIYVAESYPGAQAGERFFSLQWGAEHPGEPELDRPPATVHVVVSAAVRHRGPVTRPASLRDGLLEEPRRTYLILGRVVWAGRRGVLLLAPPFPRGGIEANHLVFRWTARGTVRTVSLHAWEPFSEVPHVLKEVVESLPP